MQAYGGAVRDVSRGGKAWKIPLAGEHAVRMIDLRQARKAGQIPRLMIDYNSTPFLYHLFTFLVLLCFLGR